MKAIAEWEKQHGPFSAEEMEQAAECGHNCERREQFGVRREQPVAITSPTPALPNRLRGRSSFGETITVDLIDAVVVTLALREKAMILTGDPNDIKRLVRSSGRNVAVVSV